MMGRTRNGERGARNHRASQCRVPHSALLVALALACNPATTRPAFVPLPEAPVEILQARPQRILTEVRDWLTAQGLKIQRSNDADTYLETAWYDTRNHRSTAGGGEGGDLLAAVKIRCWVDPDAPGRSKLTVEVIYRPMLDPSRTERDLERVVPAEHEGGKVVERLIAAMKQKFGPIPQPAPAPSPTPPSRPDRAPRPGTGHSAGAS